MNVDMTAEFQRQAVVEQLEKYGSFDHEGYTYDELVRKLAVARAMDVVVGSPHNTWF